MTNQWWILLGLTLSGGAGCVGGKTGTDTGTTTDTDTHTGDTDTGATPTDDACGPDVQPLLLLACAETTADLEATVTTTTTYGWGGYESDVIGGTGTVTEVGGDLDDVPASYPIGPFPACAPEHVQQVQLLDGYGDTWTFGWDLEGTLDEGSAAAIAVGAEVGFLTVYELEPWTTTGAIVLTDELGPLFLYELEPSLTEAERGGIGVSVVRDDACLVEAEGGYQEEHYLVSYTWEGGQADLRSGQSTPIPLPGREVELVLGRSFWQLDCLDGCGWSEWAGWAESP